MPYPHARRFAGVAATVIAPALLSGCTALGSMMSPYPEKFGCKNSDHGVCIHPEKAYEDAVAGRPSRSDPAVTNDKRLLKAHGDTPAAHDKAPPAPASTAYAGYRASVYAKLQGLIDQPVTPMLKTPRTVRTLILPYADRERPDRLYMPRYVFSLLDRPEWVVGDYLVEPMSSAEQAPILGQVKDKPLDAPAPESRP
jgi:conjugal transfer pilus assembly protein TraV